MGIAPYKTFTFDGVSSDTYGVYITGEGVFNAPDRDVEMIDIHGRNGAYAFDNGRFQNISVKYKIGMYDVNESNFATKMSNFRNWLCSKVGYVRLSDEYNPNEYRMAVYSGGLEVSHEFLIAGEAEITFECKPQRWLTSGETATAVANNGTLSNPTLFDASPLLEVKGYGDIYFSGEKVVSLSDSVPLGNVVMLDSFQTSTGQPVNKVFYDICNVGDAVNVNSAFGTCTITCPNSIIASTVQITPTHVDGAAVYSYKVADNTLTFRADATQALSFIYGTDDGKGFAYTIKFATSDAPGTTHTINYDLSVLYRHYIATYTYNYITLYSEVTTMPASFVAQCGGGYSGASAYSTKPILGDPTYIDLDIGEVWCEDFVEPVALNSAVSFGSELATLPPGSTTITYDNTITSLKIAPRWWIV